MDRSDKSDPKHALRSYLQAGRDALVTKLDGLSEREARMPRTPTGTNLAGIVKHCANVELVYLGPTFGREWPSPDDPNYVTEAMFEQDPQADWYLPREVSTAELLDFYRRVWAFTEPTIDDLPLDAPGRVAHWGGHDVNLHWILIHTLSDIDRHAGHADILREGIDSSVGWHGVGDNVPEGYDWKSYVAKLTAIAESFPA